MREIFAAESDEHAQEISKLLGQLMAGSFTGAAISSLRRRVHNLKGSASLVKLEDLSQVAHGMEDLLDVFYEQRRGPSSRELEALELAGDALQALIYGRGEGVDVAEVLKTLAGAGEAGAGESGSDPAIESAVETAETIETVQIEAVGTAETDTVEIEVAETAAAEAELETVEARPSAAAILTRPSADIAPVASIDAEPEVSRSAESAGAALRAEEDGDRQRFVRISVDALDEAMRLLVEVDAERHYLRQLVAGQRDHAIELDLADRRLHREVRALETDLEVAALGSRVPRSSGSATDTPFDPLELDRYSELHERSRSLIESTGDLGTVSADLGHELVSMEHSIERLEGSTVRLRDRLLGLRLVPFSSLTPRLEGVVRLAARSTGKQARLRVDDGGVELDKDVLDALVDPLDHLLRNAVAHGIEAPGVRSEAGKTPEGSVRLVARYGLEGVVLRVEDDGAGIDTAAVSNRAVARGLLQASDAETWSTERIRELIFQAGLSTAKEVDRVAGRGVGMDVVRERLRELRGQVRIESSSADGTVFHLELPTSLAVQRVLLVQDGGYRLALPSQGLERMERISPERFEHLGQRQVLRTGEEVFQVVRLASSAGLAVERETTTGEDPVAIFSRLGGRPTAYVVEKVLGAREVVVQDLGRHLARRPGVLGVTQAGSGHPVPILDPAAWLDGATGTVKTPVRRQPVPEPERKPVLVVDDSLSMRRYLRQLVERFGFLGIEARDGREAIELLDSGAVQPSLVLLDLEMPRMDGFELMSTLRSDARFASTPRIVLTSRDAEKHRSRAAAEGADDYLVKPVGESELESTLKRWIRRGGAR